MPKKMAPKRKTQALPEKSEILPKKRVRKTQILNVPSITTITIPNNKSNLDVPDTLRRVDVKTKIALADEVAKSQILKIPVETRYEPPKKKARGRVVISDYFTPVDVKVKSARGTIPKVETNVKKSDKKPVESLAAKKVVTRKRTADSTVKKPIIKRQRLNPKPIADNQAKVLKDNTVEPKNNSKPDTSKQTSSPIVNSKEKNVRLNDYTAPKNTIDNKSNLNCNISGPPTVPTPKNRKTKKKQANIVPPENTLQPISELSCLESPVPLTPYIDSRKPETPDIKPSKPRAPRKKSSKNRLQALRGTTPKSRSPCVTSSKKFTSKAKNVMPIYSRRNSTSSASNMSWTRDISSSSTTTCITVSSKDFVCIDNKLPFIRLTNIDSEVDKYKPAPTVSDEDSSDESSSSDFETSSAKQSSNTRHSPSDCSLVREILLNLSRSSESSVGDQIKDNELNKLDREMVVECKHCLEAVMQLLKQMDMEFVRWVHVAGCVTSDLDRIEVKLFTILINEFSALKYCRNLQEITDLEKIESPKIIITNEQEVERHTENTRFKNDKKENKNVDISVKSNEKETNRIEYNQVESATVDSNVVKSNKSDNLQLTDKLITGKNIESDTVVNKPCKNIHLTKFNGEISPPSSNRNESKPITSSEPTVETGYITSNRAESEPQEPFTKSSTSGFNLNNSKSGRVSESDDSTSENEDFRNMLFTQHAPEDDDALSLFAESITGIESSKYNTSVVSTTVEKQVEEYVPKPIQDKFISPPNYSYNPTKIADHFKNVIVKTVCEKQNADSTSIYKESNDLPSGYKGFATQADSVESNQGVIEKQLNFKINTPYNSNKPCLIADLYTLQPRARNVLIEGYCYFNLINRCTFNWNNGLTCRLTHRIPDAKEVEAKLSRLTDEVLIKEYMLTRRNIHLMRRFGMSILIECDRRRLTRVVIEIVYDVIIIFEKGVQTDENLKVAAVEIALLHLNNVDLRVCEDLLKFEVPKKTLLCEFFMETMTKTQNFSRFKFVFLNLTYFMVNNARKFCLDAAERLLERVCILPFDELVVRALIQVMRLTKPEIFLNSMIDDFEQIIKPNADVFGEYLTAKGEVNFEILARRAVEHRPPSLVDQPVLQNVMDQPPLLQPVPQQMLRKPLPQQMLLKTVRQPLLLKTVDKPLIVRPEMTERLAPSPDTTNLDNMHKITEPKITRTIQGFPFKPSPKKTFISPSSSNNEEIIQSPNFSEWRHKSIFQQIGRSNFSTPRQPMRPRGRPTRPPTRMMNRPFNQRLVTLGAKSIMYPPPGQNY